MNTRFSRNIPQPETGNDEIAAAVDLIPAPYTATLSRRFGVHVDTTSSPSATFVPESYEPNYAYPLLIWLHDEGGSERDLLTLMPVISNRNYFGMSLRGPLEARHAQPGFRWSHFVDDVIAVEEELYDQVGRLRRAYNIHSERVFVGGCGDGATAAMHLGLRRPEWFAGVVSLGGCLPAMEKPLSKYRLLQGKRVLLARGNDSNIVDELRTRGLATLLHTAGMTVCSRIYGNPHPQERDVAHDIDRWMMRECYRHVTVE